MKTFDFISINEWLNEQKNEEKTYGCVMMEPNKIDGWEEKHLAGIDEKDVYIKPSDDSYGLEENPHVTVLYGIHEDEVDPSVVTDMIEQKMEPIKVKISEIDIFENEEYDVVKYNVPVTDELKEYREMFMNSFENTQTFPEYYPHITLAYVKPGTGKKYKKTLEEPFTVKFTRGVYSYHKDGDKDNLIRKVINLEKEEKKTKGVINSKPFKK